MASATNRSGNIKTGAGSGLRRYLYEYLFHQSVERARDQTAEIIPISQAKAIRARVDERRGSDTSVEALLQAIDAEMTEAVPDYEPIFGAGGTENPVYRELRANFLREVGVGERSSATPRVPISPYDPEWAERSTIKQGGAALSYIPDEQIGKILGGDLNRLSSPDAGELSLWRVDEERGRFDEVGKAMTDDDASGLTALMGRMSAKEYDEVREWVFDGARDARGVINRNLFMSQRAVARSVAVLDELRAQGLDYEVLRDRSPGQIKAKVKGSALEVRLTEPAATEEYAGARVYDDGVVLRYSTNYRDKGRPMGYEATPDEAVDLLRFAQGLPVARRDHPEEQVGAVGRTHVERFTPRGKAAYFGAASDSYRSGSVGMFATRDLPGVRAGQEEAKVFIRRESGNRTLPRLTLNVEETERYLRQAVDSARLNFEEALDTERLISTFREQVAEGWNLVEIEPPEFAADADIAAIQRSYWDVLTGRQTELLRPGASQQMLDERLGAIGELAADEEVDQSFGNLVYTGSEEDKIRAHAQDAVEELIGRYEPETHLVGDEYIDQRFDPMRVARFMTSEKGQWSNADDLAAACRRLEINPEEMMGQGFQTDRFKDRLIRFDETTAVPMGEHESDFIRRMGGVVRDALSRGAAVPEEILIDDKGVIRWSAVPMSKEGPDTEARITGEIGQVFDVGEHGEIITRFGSGENVLIVPGYEARIAAQTPAEPNASVESRTILRGYEQMMAERIQYQVAGDLFSGRSQIGEGSSLNAVYSRLYGTKHPVDFIESATRLDAATGELVVDPWVASIVATEARRVRYTNDIREGSTLYAQYQAERGRVDPVNDNHFDAWRLTGGRNMAVLGGKDASRNRAPEGYFDPVMTGGATNQGIVRYLTAGASVGADGKIVAGDPSTPEGRRAPLMLRPELETMAYDAWDRQQMTASTIMQSSSISEPTGTALMTFGGWTADDPIVVSTEFAEKNQIRGAGGQLRSLVVGDKLSDMHGNKGVISLIVDRDMDPGEAKAQGLEQEVAWFRANPSLDVVMSPFSLISRRNAGAAREMMASVSADGGYLTSPTNNGLVDAAGHSYDGIAAGIGQLRFVITHMAVDEKTKVYDDEQVLAGRGRKASSQLAWGLQSQDCPEIMAEFYGGNSGAEANLREYMLTMGVDLAPDGTVRLVSKAPQDGRPERRFIAMPDLVRNVRGGVDARAMRRSFGELIGDRGGDMELPFPLVYPTGEKTEAVSANSWKLPVMSSHLRSGQEFEDGSSVTHDYTGRYLDIFESACRYRAWSEQLQSGDLDPKSRAKLVDNMAKATRTAQRGLDSITTDLKHRVFSGKNNYAKTGLMSSRLPDSATAVWTADPRLDIDQVAMGPAMAEQLGLAENDYALIWRDPILRDAGLRYMRVAIDERLTGVAINPVMAASFEGDFDGDAVAVVKLHTEAAKSEAMRRLSVPMNLENKGVAPMGSYPLGMNISLDTKVALSKDADLAEEFSSAEREMNRIALRVRQAGSTIEAEREAWADYSALTEELSENTRRAQRSEFGSALSFASPEALRESMKEVCVDTGAKGSEKKLDDFMRYFGDESGQTGITAADQEASQLATNVKQSMAGIAGGVSQRGMRGLRNIDPEAVTETTAPVSQSVLQAKHDADEAWHKTELLYGAGRDHWRGRLLEQSGDQWRPVFEDGKPVQATRDQWEAQFIELYTSGAGFNVKINPEYVGRVAQALEDPVTGQVRSIEDLEVPLMDRLAYGGDFDTLVDAAKAEDNLYEGKGNAQFASAATRRILQGAEPTNEVESSAPQVHAVKRDVLAETEAKAQARGARRRSEQAVTVRIPESKRPVTYTPSIEIRQSEADDMARGVAD